MYSYEDRLRAVQLYIKLGKRVGLTIRKLCYLTENALKTWHREYEQRLALPTGYRPPAVLAVAQGAGRRALPRAWPLHRSDDQVAGLSLEVIAVRVAPRALPAGACASHWSIRGTGAHSQAICRQRLVHASSNRAGGGLGAGRVSRLQSAAMPRTEKSPSGATSAAVGHAHSAKSCRTLGSLRVSS